MSDEIYLGNKTYVSSKRAAKECGYAQDYVGQLARGGLIDAQRVGGLWYVYMDSLEAYKRNADTYTPKQPEPSQVPKELDTIVSFDGKDYVSAARAAKLTGYNPDYVGQLARSGKIFSRQVGNRWYIEREGLLTHKTQKDALLANVQAESVGLQRIANPVIASPTYAERTQEPYLTYIREDDSLMPVLTKPEQPTQDLEARTEMRPIPIRVIAHAPRRQVPRKVDPQMIKSARSSVITMNKAVKAALALTVVIVVSYGFTSIKSESLYAFLQIDSNSQLSQHTMTAAAASAFERIGDAIESIVAPVIRYERAK